MIGRWRRRPRLLETLGFETRIDGEFGEGERWIEVAPPGAETTIALVDSQANEVSFATDDADAAHAPRQVAAACPCA